MGFQMDTLRMFLVVPNPDIPKSYYVIPYDGHRVVQLPNTTSKHPNNLRIVSRNSDGEFSVIPFGTACRIVKVHGRVKKDLESWAAQHYASGMVLNLPAIRSLNFCDAPFDLDEYCIDHYTEGMRISFMTPIDKPDRDPR